MSAPRLEVDLTKVAHNARTLVARLEGCGIGVTGVTKAALGSPELGRALVEAGVRMLGDSRVENLERLRRADLPARLVLIRSPMVGQLDRVVRCADVSFNTEVEVLAGLSAAAGAHATTHGVVLMVELGDLREGILPADLADAVEATLRLPHVTLEGLGTNLACRSGVVPDAAKMAELSSLTASVEARFGIDLGLVSGGNSANLGWALGGQPVGRVNDLRLGESLLLGLDPLHRRPIDGLHTDAVALVAEVIESKCKPSMPWGRLGQAAFGAPAVATDTGSVAQTILAVGEQDVDPLGLQPPPGVRIVGASSDHLVVTASERFPIGAEVRFTPNYSALLRAMTSPFVDKHLGSSPALPADPLALRLGPGDRGEQPAGSRAAATGTATSCSSGDTSCVSSRPVPPGPVG